MQYPICLLNTYLDRYKLWIPLCFFFVLLFTSFSNSSEAKKKNILIVFSYEYGMPAYNIVEQTIRSELNTDNSNIIYFNEQLDLSRFIGEKYKNTLKESFYLKYNHLKFDLIITIMKPAFDFIQSECKDLFPGVPIVYGLIDEGFDKPKKLPANTSGFAMNVSIDGTIKAAMKIQPDAQHMVIVSDKTQLGQLLEERAKQAIDTIPDQISVTSLSNFSMEKILIKVHNLSSDTIVLYLVMSEDGDGKPIISTDALKMISDVSNAPVYGLWDILLEHRMTGGCLSSFVSLGRNMAEKGKQILNGQIESPSLITIPNTHMFNWRQLQRWGIKEQNLPSGSRIKFKEMSVWDTYKKQILIVFLICISEAILIGFLLVQRRKTKLSEIKRSKTKKFRDNLIKTANVLILGFDTQGNVTLLNSAVEKLTGYLTSEFEGKNLFNILVPGKSDQAAGHLFNNFMNESLPKLSEYKIQTKDGRERIILWSNNAIKQNGKVEGTILIGIDITERKHAERLLKESEEKYRELIDNTSDISYRSSIDGYLIFLSKAVQRLTGYTVEEAIGSNIADMYLYPEERKKVMAILKKWGHISDYEVQFKHKDGSIWWASSNSQLFTDQNGNILGVEGTIRDITRRKIAEEELRKNEERLRLALEGTNTGFYEWYPVTNETYFSPTFFTMLGYEPDKFPHNYNTWADLLHPEDKLAAETVVKDFLQKRQSSFKHEFRIRSKKNGYHWILSRGAAMEWDEKGRIQRIIGTHSDITDSKLAEEMLRDREMRLRTMFDQTFQFMGLLSLKGNLLTVNRVALEFIKAKEADVIDKLFWETPWWTHSAKEQKKILQAIKKAALGEYISFETTHIDPSGNLHHIDTSLKPILGDDGRIIYLCAEGRDITDKKQGQKERVKLEKQLHQAQKMEAIGTLAGGIAHDFNNILGAIIGFSELALEDIKEGDPVRYSIDQVLQSAFRAKELVEQILLFSRQGKHKMKPVKITSLIKEVIKLLRSTLQKTIDVKENILIKKDMVLADPVKIHQILMNLCTNSAHAMGEKGGTLTVTLDQIDFDKKSLMEFSDLKSGSYLKLKVTDTGHGIPEKLIDKIFDPFFTTKPRGEGTGLGLAVVHGIVKDHKGNIKVYSEPGKGTAIHIFLPLLKADDPLAVKDDKPISGGTEHILLVDDEIPLIKFGKQTLQRLGYRVTAFSDSRIAWETFQKNPNFFDMVITDKTMPEITGLMLSEKIVNLCPEIPIILCTGFGDELSLKEAEKIGVKAMLHKPVIKKDLAETIRRVLDQTREKGV